MAETQTTRHLLPCPFCGAHRRHLEIVPPICHPDDLEQVECPCGASMVAPYGQSAVADWNRRADGWVSVEERLPRTTSAKLVSGRAGRMSAYCEAEKWFAFCVGPQRQIYDVTHWRPLPAPPESES